jgi:corrinoid protein of di/trimethylamine methyltransferase
MSGQLLKNLRQALLTYDAEATEKATKEIVRKGISPLEANEVFIKAIREVGDLFGRMEIYLPELMMAAEAMNAGVAILEPEILKRHGAVPTLGKIIIGTVKGDIHDLGKKIVIILLRAAGFEVLDIGNDVGNSSFAEAIERHRPDIVGLSATMTTTMESERDVIEYLEALGLREDIKIMVGGAVITSEYAEEIRADAFAENANEAVEIAKKIMSNSG